MLLQSHLVTIVRTLPDDRRQRTGSGVWTEIEKVLVYTVKGIEFYSSCSATGTDEPVFYHKRRSVLLFVSLEDVHLPKVVIVDTVK